MELPKIAYLLHSAGCNLSLTEDEDEYISCFSAMNKLTKEAEIFTRMLQNVLNSCQYKEFNNLIIDIKELLIESHLTILVKDCDAIINNVEKGKYIICEALLERFCNTLNEISYSYFGNREKIKHMSSASKEFDLYRKSKGNIGEKKTILAVDDSPEILNSIRGMLEKEYNFYGVSSPRGALRFLDKQHPDIFIFDIEMPGMSGIELAESINIKEMKKPLIFLTSNAFTHNVQAAVAVGASEFIVKPCNEKVLLDKIRKCLETK